MACVVAVMTTAQAKPMDQAKLSIHKNNIKVWTYQNAQNPVFLYKAETTFDVPIEKAVSLILDVDHAVKWVPYMGSVKVLSRDDKKGEFQLYMVLDFPFPLKDRDLVVQGKMTKDSQGIISIKNKAIDKNILKNLEVTGKSLLLTADLNKNVYLSSRNLPKSEVMTVKDANTYEIINADVLVISENSVNQLKTSYEQI